MKINIAIFASGNGSNAENIIDFFDMIKRPRVAINLIVSNKKKAFVVKRASNHGVPLEIITKEDLHNEERMLDILSCYKIDYIILAGFLLLIPEYLVKAYPKRIINIHPALLPNYGGKGMYGMNVHKAVIENKEKESGITIHYVNEKYDDGDIIFQAKCSIEKNDTPKKLAKKIHELEFEHFPKVLFDVFINDKRPVKNKYLAY